MSLYSVHTLALSLHCKGTTACASTMCRANWRGFAAVSILSAAKSCFSPTLCRPSLCCSPFTSWQRHIRLECHNPEDNLKERGALPAHLPWPPNERSICDLCRLPGMRQSPYSPYQPLIGSYPIYNHLRQGEGRGTDESGNRKGCLESKTMEDT